MVDIDTNSVLHRLEAQNDLKKGVLLTKGFRPFANRTLTGLSDQDVTIVEEVVQSYLSRAIELSQERYRRRRTARRFQSRRQQRQGPVLYKRDVEMALLYARQDLIKPDSGLSSSAREFIKDHCPCA